MNHLLYIQASPMKAASASAAVADAWLAGWREANPASTVDVLNVWDLPMPDFNADMIAAKFAVLRTQEASAEQASLWERAVTMSSRFNRADEFLFSIPMWNFGIPYRLKHFIDIVTLPEQNWRWSRDNGYVALLPGKRATLVYSSAGSYPAQPDEDASDFQKPYMRRWLRFLGVEVVSELSASPTLASPHEVQSMKERTATEAALRGRATL